MRYSYLPIFSLSLCHLTAQKIQYDFHIEKILSQLHRAGNEKHMNSEMTQTDTQLTFSISNPEHCERLLYSRLKDFKDLLLFANTDDELTVLASQVDDFLRKYDSIKQAHKNLQQSISDLTEKFILN